MSELENLIRQIVREEIKFYLQQNVDNQCSEAPSPLLEAKEEKEKDEIDYDLFEKKYQKALRIDDEVREKYKPQVEVYGSSVTLNKASEILNMSVYAIRKLAKTDKNFPVITRSKIGTARLMHWLDGGKAYWNIGEDND